MASFCFRIYKQFKDDAGDWMGTALTSVFEPKNVISAAYSGATIATAALAVAEWATPQWVLKGLITTADPVLSRVLASTTLFAAWCLLVLKVITMFLLADRAESCFQFLRHN